MGTKVALFTDTLDEMNGVSRFIRDIARLANESGHELTILTSSPSVRFDLPYRVNFPPVYWRKLPYYPDIPFVIPPHRKMMQWVIENKADVFEISTPGLVGLAGMKIARKLKLPTVGVYHTDFPAFVRDITGSQALTRITRTFMKRLYGRMDRVFSRTTQYFPIMEDVGIARSRMLLTLPFVDLTRFHNRDRGEALWQRMGVTQKHKLLYCGRVSKEKNLPMLVDIFLEIARRRTDTALIIAGYGPYLEELKQRLELRPAYYLGYLTDPELAELYASSDLYVFPSLTDTLGQVVLESQACGTPVLVSDVGGPKEVVQDKVTGLVLPGADPQAWVSAIMHLLNYPKELEQMRTATQEYVKRFSQQNAFQDFWRHLEAVANEGMALRR